MTDTMCIKLESRSWIESDDVKGATVSSKANACFALTYIDGFVEKIASLSDDDLGAALNNQREIVLREALKWQLILDQCSTRPAFVKSESETDVHIGDPNVRVQ